MWGRALLLLLAAAFCSGDENQLKVGRSMNIFSRFGYMSICMKVVPRSNETEQPWIFREPTVDVFGDIDRYVSSTRREADFHMEFCDNLRQLFQAYFRNYTFEYLSSPWHAFTGSWKSELIARNMGINSSFVTGDHCYVLVRLSRFRESFNLAPLPNSVDVLDAVNEQIENIRPGDAASVVQFIKKFGSHYISSFTTGNSAYQVFVYRRSVYQRIKQRLKSQMVRRLPASELTSYFSPWFAEHIGQIRIASGNRTVEKWASKNIREEYFIFTFESLLKLHKDAALLNRLREMLGNEALLQINLKTLSVAIKEPRRRLWFQEVVDNYLDLWEVNM